MFTWLKRLFGTKKEQRQQEDITTVLWIADSAEDYARHKEKRKSNGIKHEIIQNAIPAAIEIEERIKEKERQLYREWVANCREVEALRNRRAA